MNLDKILFTPLAIPELKFNKRKNIVKLYNEFANDISKPSVEGFPTLWKGVTCFKSETFIEDELLHKGCFLNLEAEMSEEIEILQHYLPIQLDSISLWTNVRHVNSHHDKKIYHTDEDFRFRFILCQTFDSFFIDYNNKQRYVRMPVDSNVFCFNNNICRHGGTYRHDNTKILGVIRGKIINSQQLTDLLEKSILQYQLHCFTVDNF